MGMYGSLAREIDELRVLNRAMFTLHQPLQEKDYARGEEIVGKMNTYSPSMSAPGGMHKRD